MVSVSARFLAPAALGCLVALVTRLPSAEACCPAFAEGARVAIADQEILIVWDQERGIEHFVRRAGFETAGRSDFGFLVPTPTKPALAEAPTGVFDALRDATKPVPEAHYQPDLMPLVLYPLTMLLMRSKSESAVAGSAVDPVRVLDRQTVAGYDAVVLEADDAAALARWLRDNGYDARPEIEEWAQPYVAARWKITAFKYAAGPSQAGAPVATGAVRLSFATERPLFPYRVPTDQLAKPGAGHMLRVFFASDTRFDGALGPAGAPWSGTVRFANRVDGLPALVGTAAPDEGRAKASWLTVFEDRTWPSGREDLFFARAATATPVVPTYEVPRTIPVPLDAVALVGYLGFRLAKRRRRPPDTTPP
jgi:hypothetical protein